jgi:phospholipase D-like protein
MKLFSSPLRLAMEDVFKSVERELVIVSPYIKESETRWLNERFQGGQRNGLRLSVLTDVCADSVLCGALDVSALYRLAGTFPRATVTTLPRLHAKVYIADSSFALVTSANFTRPGMDLNAEYGIGIDNPEMVMKIKEDMLSYCRLGNILSIDHLAELRDTAERLASEFQRVQRAATTAVKRQFRESFREAHVEFLRAKVGNRSSHAIFAEALLYLLSRRAMPTVELQTAIKDLLPDLCTDEDLVINGQKFGKRWKHGVRTAQVYLRRGGRIYLDDGIWKLVPNGEKK